MGKTSESPREGEDSSIQSELDCVGIVRLDISEAPGAERLPRYFRRAMPTRDKRTVEPSESQPSRGRRLRSNPTLRARSVLPGPLTDRTLPALRAMAGGSRFRAAPPASLIAPYRARTKAPRRVSPHPKRIVRPDHLSLLIDGPPDHAPLEN